MRHFTETEITEYFSGKLPVADLLWFDDHLRECKECAARMSSMATENNGAIPDFLEEAGADVHLDYDQLAAYADNKIDDVEREIVDVHAKACDFCADQLSEILALREYLATGEIARKKDADNHPGLLSFFFRIAVPAFGLVAAALIIWAFWPARSAKEIAAIPEPANSTVNASPEPSVVGTETGANTEGPERSPAMVRIVDGSSTIELLPDGSVTGVDAAFAPKVARVLKGGELVIDNSRKQLRYSRGVLMGDNEPAKSFSVTAPVGKVLLTDRPEFRWDTVRDADSYEVDVFDSNFNAVASSGPLKTNRWTPARSLKRGIVYQWQVTANVGGEKIKSPVQPAGPAKFKIVNSAKAAEIERARGSQPDRHLTLGILYAEAGLIDEAIKQFEQLAMSNPDSELPRRWLKKLRSAR